MSKQNSRARAANDAPAIYALKRENSGWKLNRRSLLGAAAAALAPGSAQAQGNACPAGVRASTSSIQTLLLHPTQSALLSVDLDNLKFWRLPGGEHYRTINLAGSSSYAISDAAVSPDGLLLYAAHEGLLKVYSLTDGALRSAHSAGWGDLSLSPDGRTLVYGDSNVQIWSVPEMTKLRTVSGSYRDPVAISPDGRFFACATFTALEVRCLPDGSLLRSLPTPLDTVNAITWSPDGELLLAGLLDGHIMIWSVPDGRLIQTLVGHSESPQYSNYITDLAISPDGRFLASSSRDRTIRTWAFPDGRLLATLRSSETLQMSTVLFAETGSLLAGAGTSNRIQFFSVPDFSPTSCLVDLAASSSDATATQYKVGGVTYTAPCGTPVPSGAVCTCNCVPGTWTGGGGGGGGHYWYPN